MTGRSPSDWVEFVYLAPYERFAKHEIPDAVEQAFETAVVENPEIGNVVPGLTGVRKVRVALPGRGKRGGARFLYFYHAAHERVYVLTAYVKNVQPDLTPISEGGFCRFLMTWSEAMSAKRNLGDELIEALDLVRDMERGKGRGAARVHLVPRTARESIVPPAPPYSHRRVGKLRARLALSQPIFAAALNVSPETVRAWEQGKRHPDGAALRLLELTEQRPDLLLSLVSEKVRKPYAARVLKRISQRTPVRLKDSAASIIRAARDGGSSSS